MRRILLIAKRDYLASIRSKAFLFGLVVAPVLFGGGFLGSAVLGSKPSAKERRIVILDGTWMAAPAIIEAAEEKNNRELFDKITGKQAGPRYRFETLPVDEAKLSVQRLELSERVRRGEIFAFLEIGAEAVHPKDAAAIPVGYYTNAGGIDDMRRWLAEPVNNGLRRVRLAQLGVDRRHFEELLGSVSLERMSLASRDEKTGQIREARKRSEIEGFAIPFAMMMLLAMIVMVGAGPMLSGVAEDKMQRVFEMLLGSASPFELMMGKMLAAVGRSLTSSVFYVISGILTLQGLAMIGLAPFSILPWFFVYLVAEVMMLSALGMALGAACSSPQDAQNLAVLLLSPVMIPLFVLVPVLQQSNGVAATALSLFPPFTPLLMLLRQALPAGVPAWQPWVGLMGVLVLTVATTWAAARIFRVAILLQGKAPKAAELLRWAVRG